jgi:DNA polymerase-1
MPLVLDHDRLQKVFNQLKSSTKIVYDAETSGLDWRKNHIVGHVITFSPNPKDSWYIPVRHKPGGNYADNHGPSTLDGWNGRLHALEHDLLKALDRPELTMVGHNLGFDLKFLYRMGFKMRPKYEDTSLYAPLLDEYIGKYGLEACAQRAGVQAKKSSEITAYLAQRFPEASRNNLMGEFWRLSGDDPVAVDYACGDGTSTWQLRDWQWAELEKQQEVNKKGEVIAQMTNVASIENRLLPVLVRMSVLGIKIDQVRVAEVLHEVDAELKKLNAAFPEDFNARGPKSVRAWMESHGHTDWPMTAPSKNFPEGQPSFKETWLEQTDAGKQVIKVRKLDNMKASFVLPLRDEHMWKGRVHTNYNQLRNDEFGTVTGRLSSNAPNVQQIPKRDPVIGPLIRSAFIPDEGMLWGDADYKQIEPRLLAYYSGCKVLMDDFMNNPDADAHRAVAMSIQGERWGKMSPPEQKVARENGKRVNQTLITGGGKGVIVEKYGVDPREVDKIWNDYFKAMPEIRTLQQKAARVYRSRGWVTSLLGRRARIDFPSRDYTAVNRLLQVGNADVLKAKMVEVGEFLESEKIAGRNGVDMLLNCHDAISFQFLPEKRKLYRKCLDIMQDVTTGIIKLPIPMPVDTGEGKNWAIASFGEPK